MALIAAYSFDESGTYVSDFAGSNGFTLTGGAARVPGHGGVGNALSPSGTTKPVLPDIGKTDLRTVMAWVKGSMPDAWLIEWHSDTVNSGAWGIVSVGGKIGVQGWNNTTEARAEVPWDTTAWHHVAGTFDGATISLYVDCVLVDSVDLAGPLRVDTNPPTLFGWDSQGAVSLDDLRIYDTVLDHTGITAAMNNSVGVAGLAQAAELATDPTFVSRVTAAMVRHGVTLGSSILAGVSANGDGNDKARLRLAQAVLADHNTYGAQFAWAVASDSDVDLTVEDSHITKNVAEVWDLIAGVSI